MGTRFRGWPDHAYTVMFQLGGEPSRELRERVRHDREAQVRQPMIELLSDLADVDSWYEDFAVWGYASTAYWWQNQCAIVRVARNVVIGFRFSLDGLRIGASWRYASSEHIALFRAAVAADQSGRVLQDLLASLAEDGHEILGDVMSRVPRGYPAAHPRAALLRHRSLVVAREIESEAIHDVQPVYRACERLRPLLAWLAEHAATAPQAAQAATVRKEAEPVTTSHGAVGAVTVPADQSPRGRLEPGRELGHKRPPGVTPPRSVASRQRVAGGRSVPGRW